MTKKTNPYALRLGYNQTWNTLFFAHQREEQRKFISQDKKIRDYFSSLNLDIAHLKIEYLKNNINIFLHILDTGLILGKENFLNEILKKLYQIINNRKIVLKVNVIEVKNVYSDAQTIANLIAAQLKKRLKSRTVIRGILIKIVSERSCKGLKIVLKGLMDGNGMAQTKKTLWGKLSLNTLDNDINVGFAEAVTGRGVIGVRVFLNLGKKNHKEQFKKTISEENWRNNENRRNK